MVHKIEVFTAGCPLCLNTMKAVKEATKDCGIKAVPSIVVDGKIAHVGKLSAEEFKQHI